MNSGKKKRQNQIRNEDYIRRYSRLDLSENLKKFQYFIIINNAVINNLFCTCKENENALLL